MVLYARLMTVRGPLTADEILLPTAEDLRAHKAPVRTRAAPMTGVAPDQVEVGILFSF